MLTYPGAKGRGKREQMLVKFLGWDSAGLLTAVTQEKLPCDSHFVQEEREVQKDNGRDRFQMQTTFHKPYLSKQPSNLSNGLIGGKNQNVCGCHGKYF